MTDETADVRSIGFGDKVKDRVSGVTGTVVATNEWWSGRSSFGIEPSELKDGCIQDVQWIDKHRVELIPEE